MSVRPRLNNFRDELLTTMSRAMARKTLSSLRSLLRDAQHRGNRPKCSFGCKADRCRQARQASDQGWRRHSDHGRDQAILTAAGPRVRPLLLTATFTGLRSSELRGLRWSDIDLKKGELHVRQRADRYGVIGPPKSKSGYRTVPLGPTLISVLREWKVACPNNEHDLVFPTPSGDIALHNNVVRALIAAVRDAGLMTANGKPKYNGPHALRHFFASWCINPLFRGGQGLPPKVVQHQLGHSTIAMTMDTYGHLFPVDEDADKRLANAERVLLG